MELGCRVWNWGATKFWGVMEIFCIMIALVGLLYLLVQIKLAPKIYFT